MFLVMSETPFLVDGEDFCTVEDMIAKADRVVSRWTMRPSHQGAQLGIASTGQQATWTGMTIYRFAGGTITERWELWGTLGLLHQLSHIPPEPAGGICARRQKHDQRRARRTSA